MQTLRFSPRNLQMNARDGVQSEQLEVDLVLGFKHDSQNYVACPTAAPQLSQIRCGTPVATNVSKGAEDVDDASCRIREARFD